MRVRIPSGAPIRDTKVRGAICRWTHGVCRVKKTILIVGLGQLGSLVFDLMLRLPSQPYVVAAVRDGEKFRQRFNLGVQSALQLGHSPRASLVEIDVSNLDQVAETIRRIRPDIVFSAVTLQSWWVLTTLPKDRFESIDRAQVGPWLPVHLTLVHCLMKAVRASGVQPIVVNASFPDVVHPVLAKVGLAPNTGIGNIANPLPALRMSIAERLRVNVDSIELRAVLHHYVSHRVSRVGDAGGAPFHVTVLIDGQDASRELNRPDLFKDLPTRFRRPGGMAGQPMTAAAAVRVLTAIAEDRQEVLHVPGPNGLPGGYPARIGGEGVEVVLPPTLTMPEAIAINEAGARYEGIDRIDPDGTVHFSAENMVIMRECLGYDCAALRLDESRSRANDLIQRYQRYAMSSSGSLEAVHA